MMYWYSTHISPNTILNHIIKSGGKDKRYIITGKSGITGKTWLTNQLQSKGYDAIEISELIYDSVEYTRCGNSVIENDSVVLIILNCRYEILKET